MIVGYRRTSTIDQNLDRQELPGAEKIFEEKLSGANANRPALQEMIEFCREGDQVLIHSIDRLARNLGDLLNIIEKLNGKGVTVKFLTEGLSFSANSNDSFAKLQLQILASFAEFERAIAKRRQAEGIAKAKMRGIYKGRPASIDAKKIHQLREDGHTVSSIAEKMNVSRMSVYRALRAS